MVIVHLYSGGRTGTYQRGLLPQCKGKYTILGSFGKEKTNQQVICICVNREEERFQTLNELTEGSKSMKIIYQTSILWRMYIEINVKEDI